MENETQAQTECATPADSAAEELQRFVAENRQHLPPLPVRPSFPNLEATPESDRKAAEREARLEHQQEQRRRADLYRRYNDLVDAAGARYRDCALTNFVCGTPQKAAVVRSLTKYLEHDSWQSVVLYGPIGTGKDHLAFAVCVAAIKNGKTVRWINGQQWFGAVRDAMDTDRSEASLIAELARPDLLCVSDPLPPVGALTQHQATMLYRLIDARYSKGLPTVCTINVSSDQEADERMGAATWDRLTHDAWKLFCNWPSYRKPAREV